MTVGNVHLLADATKDRQLIQLDQEMNDLLPSLFVSRISVIKKKDTPKSVTNFSLGITVYDSKKWHFLTNHCRQFYTTSVFAQQTGWHQWFEKIENSVQGWVAF